MEAQVTQLIAFLAQQVWVVVNLRGVDLVVQLHFACTAGFHLVLAGLDLGPQLGPAAALLEEMGLCASHIAEVVRETVKG